MVQLVTVRGFNTEVRGEQGEFDIAMKDRVFGDGTGLQGATGYSVTIGFNTGGRKEGAWGESKEGS